MKKLFVLSPKRMALLTCVLAAALMFGAVNMPAVVASATQRQLPIYCVERDQKMISISFEVMNHSNTHAHMSQLSRDEIIADVNACNDKIEAVTGVRPTLIRPPYGEYDDNVITAIRSMDMEPIQWDVDSLDWKDLSAADITQRVTSKVQAGSIVLFHNAAKHTPEALPTILETLLQEGYTFVPISQLILPGECNTDYTIDHTGRQQAAG